MFTKLPAKLDERMSKAALEIMPIRAATSCRANLKHNYRLWQKMITFLRSDIVSVIGPDVSGVPAMHAAKMLQKHGASTQ